MTTEPEMDARVASRLADVAAERRLAEHRVRRRRALVALVGLAVVAVTLGVALSPLLGAHHVEVVGARRTRAADVRAASRLDPSDPLVRLDGAGVTRRVEALPWVRTATLERRWPQTVRIRVVERGARAVAPCAEGACLVDETGRVLAAAARSGSTGAPDAVDPGGIPVLTDVPPAGAPGSQLPEAARPVLAVALALPEALTPLVLAVRGSPTGVEIALVEPGRERNPPVVRMGDATRLGEKLTAAATVLTNLGPTGRVGLVALDVRVPGAPAITRNDRP